LLCVDTDSQRSFKKLRLTPVECCIFDSETVTKDAKKCLMVDRIKCGAKIEENKRTHVTGVDTTYNLVVHGDDGGLGRVTSSVSGLTTGQKLLQLDVCTESDSSNTLHDLR